jgi:hypothetical protein
MFYSFLAESEGVEPPIPFGIAAFKAVWRADAELSIILVYASRNSRWNWWDPKSIRNTHI